MKVSELNFGKGTDKISAPNGVSEEPSIHTNSEFIDEK